MEVAERHAKLAKVCAEISAELANHKDKLDSVTDHNSGLKRQISTLQDQIEGYKAQMKDMNGAAESLIRLRKMYAEVVDERNQLQKTVAELQQENEHAREELRSLRDPEIKKLKTDDWNAVHNNNALYLLKALNDFLVKRGSSPAIMMEVEAKLMKALENFVEWCVDVQHTDKSIWRTLDHNKAAMTKLKEKETTRLENAVIYFPSIVREDFFHIGVNTKKDVLVSDVVKFYTPHATRLFAQCLQASISQSADDSKPCAAGEA